MLWLGIASGMILFGLIVLVRSRGFTYYHPRGFRSFTIARGDDELAPVSRDRLARILAHLPAGERLDFLQVSHRNDPYGGVAFNLEDGEVMLRVNFRPFQEAEWIDAFRSEMTAWGYPPVEEYPWNVGLGPDLESVMLKFRAPKDLVVLQALIDQALTHLDGPAGESLFVLARKFDIPGARRAIRLNARPDPLAEIP